MEKADLDAQYGGAEERLIRTALQRLAEVARIDCDLDDAACRGCTRASQTSSSSDSSRLALVRCIQTALFVLHLNRQICCGAVPLAASASARMGRFHPVLSSIGDGVRAAQSRAEGPSRARASPHDPQFFYGHEPSRRAPCIRSSNRGPSIDCSRLPNMRIRFVSPMFC